MKTSPVLQAKDLIKIKNIVKGTIDQTLAAALSQLSRSHDALFVFDQNNVYKGVINPYYTTFKSRFPGETKLDTCLFRPPVLSLDTSIWDIAHLMAESKIYYLPVMNKNEFIGIVTINRVLRAMLTHVKSIHSAVVPHTSPVISIRDNATVKQAHTLMKDRHVSRLPVVNETGKMVGIVTRFDIREAYTKPREKQTFLSRSGEKEPADDQPINSYYKKMVFTVNRQATSGQICKLMVENNIGSVVVTDTSHRPIGIISTHDVLKMISSLRPKQVSGAIVHTPDDFIDKAALITVSDSLLHKMSRLFPHTEKLEVIVEPDKNSAGKVREYTVKLLMHQDNGHTVVATDTHFNWKTALLSAGKKLRRQFED